MEVVIVDRYSKSAYAVRVGKRGDGDKRPPKGKGRPRLWYNRRTAASLKQITNKIYKLYEYTTSKAYTGEPIIWLTLTTLQHKTGKTDKDLLYCFKKFFQHRTCSYINVVERQRNTGDIHFHLIVQNDSHFNFKAEVERWASILGVEPNPNLFVAKEITDLPTLRIYISKYIRKPCPSWSTIEKWFHKYGNEAKFPYSSLFWCRTTTSGGEIFRSIDKRDFAVRIPKEYESFLKLTDKKYGEFTDNYSYSDELYNRSQNLYRCLRRAGLVDDWYNDVN